jgi:hypothetical protein
MTAAPKKPAATVVEIRAQIAAAEAGVCQADAHFGRVAFEQLGDPSIETRPALALLEDARAALASLEAALPIAEQAEGAALEETRAKLAADQRAGLERSLRQMIKEALSYSRTRPTRFPHSGVSPALAMQCHGCSSTTSGPLAEAPSSAG